MPPFKQAPHDPAKAAMSGVTTFIPKRSEPDRSHTCADCPKTATWEVTADGKTLHVCDTDRREYLLGSLNYTEKRLR